MSNAVYYDILLTVQSGIQALSLTGLTSGNVLLHKIPTNAVKDLPSTKYPCVIVAPYGRETLDPPNATNLRLDIIYPVLVGLLISDNTSQTSDFNRTLDWRRQIIGKFHQKPSVFSAITGPYHVSVEPQAVVDPGAWLDKNLFASALVVNVKSREAR